MFKVFMRFKIIISIIINYLLSCHFIICNYQII